LLLKLDNTFKILKKMDNQNQSKKTSFLNKGISTSKGIAIILLAFLICGGIVDWQQEVKAQETELLNKEVTGFAIIILAYLGVSFLVGLPFYIYFAVCLMFLAKKTQTSHRWMAWIPILNIYLLCKIAGKHGWWLIYFFLPIIILLFAFLPNLPHVLMSVIILLASLASLAIPVILIILWREIAVKLNRPRFWGTLIIIPIINLIIMGFLAFSKKESQDLN